MDVARRDRMDACLAVLVLALCAVNVGLDEELRGGRLPVTVALSLGAAVAVALRHRLPERMLVLTLVGCVVQGALDIGVLATVPAVYAVVSTVAVHGAPWAVVLALAGGVGAAVSGAVWSIARDEMPVGAAAQLGVAVLLPFTLSWALGFRRRCQRCYRSQLAERADSVERIDEARRQAALAAQRAEICREMYDITGHRVAGMVVQAEAAGRVLDRAPGQARQALRTIAHAGRESETELRRTLGLLRGSERR
ncbi:histidine kinase dimerization/phosphoacceptor domain-containing protein [Streptomyces millisiae]|uniref:histidine kinase n=1 Tax=Streptomyces millisiae TaxID=3075542 RepID=A0ABU2LIQ2_9ACTN|nr:histidine kinase dimerization/phosphoacceptor domain-containing protein [Streptomyces sp. DSM 44918]MDT0317464.1 histidine kinase dimerization/phosphoacceptor domain-containing protein [Streptomyces sp. DSM 44918]